jgi:hypothetical protein
MAQSFAPVNRSGTFRTLAFVRHLDRCGWRATVITAIDAAANTDDSLAELIPPTTSIGPTRNFDLLRTVKNWRHRLPRPSRPAPSRQRFIGGQDLLRAGCEEGVSLIRGSGGFLPPLPPACACCTNVRRKSSIPPHPA